MTKTPILLMLLINAAILPQISADEDFSPTSFINLNYGRDSSNTDYYQFQLSEELENYHQFNVGVGRSISSSTLLNTQQFSIGIATNPYNSFSISTDFSSWENDKALKSQSLRSDFYINSDNWRFNLGPSFNTAIFEKYNYTMSSKGIAIAVDYYGIENFFFGGHYYVNQYLNSIFSDKTQIQRDRILAQISDSTQLLITSLEKYQTGLSIGYFFNRGSIELTLTQSKAAFVDETISSTSVLTDFQLNKTIGLSLIFTRQISNISNQQFDIVDFGLTYQF